MSDGISDMMQNMGKIIKAFDYLLHLHNCEQEGIESGQPTPEQWYKAVEDAEKALIELKEIYT